MHPLGSCTTHSNVVDDLWGYGPGGLGSTSVWLDPSQVGPCEAEPGRPPGTVVIVDAQEPNAERDNRTEPAARATSLDAVDAVDVLRAACEVAQVDAAAP